MKNTVRDSRKVRSLSCKMFFKGLIICAVLTGGFPVSAATVTEYNGSGWSAGDPTTTAGLDAYVRNGKAWNTSGNININAGSSLTIGGGAASAGTLNISNGIFYAPASETNSVTIQDGGKVATGDGKWLAAGQQNVTTPGTINITGGQLIGTGNNSGPLTWYGGKVVQTGGLVGEALGSSYSGNTLIHVGADSTGYYTISGGTINVATISMAYNADGDGYMTIDGGTVKVNNFEVGRQGKGTLKVNAGTVNANSLKVAVAGGSKGTLIINDGKITTNLTEIGAQSAGSMTMNGGSLSTTNDLYVAINPGSSANVEINGGTLNVGSNLCVSTNKGATGGKMVINGGEVITKGTHIGYFENTYAELTLNGGSLKTTGNDTNGDFTVGRLGIGGKLVVNGGTLTATKFNLAEYGNVTFDLNGGSVTVAEFDLASYQGSEGHFTMNGGEMNVTNKVETGWKYLGGQHFDFNGGKFTAKSFLVGSGLNYGTESGHAYIAFNGTDATLGDFSFYGGKGGIVEINAGKFSAGYIGIGVQGASFTINGGDVTVGSSGAGLVLNKGGNFILGDTKNAAGTSFKGFTFNDGNGSRSEYRQDAGTLVTTGKDYQFTTSYGQNVTSYVTFNGGYIDVSWLKSGESYNMVKTGAKIQVTRGQTGAQIIAPQLNLLEYTFNNGNLAYVGKSTDTTWNGSTWSSGNPTDASVTKHNAVVPNGKTLSIASANFIDNNLTIQNGATLNVTGMLTVYNNTAAQTTVTIQDGAKVNVTNGNAWFCVGPNGAAKPNSVMNIEGGTIYGDTDNRGLICWNGGVINQTGGLVGVETTAGSYTDKTCIHVAGGSYGTYNISDGRIDIARLRLSYNGNSYATMNVSGGVVKAQFMTIGETDYSSTSTGLLNITGGTVDFNTADLKGKSAEIRLDGGSLNIEKLTVYNNSTLSLNGGNFSLKLLDDKSTKGFTVTNKGANVLVEDDSDFGKSYLQEDGSLTFKLGTTEALGTLTADVINILDGKLILEFEESMPDKPTEYQLFEGYDAATSNFDFQEIVSTGTMPIQWSLDASGVLTFYDTNSIPEPATWILLLGLGACLPLIRRRK